MRSMFYGYAGLEYHAVLFPFFFVSLLVSVCDSRMIFSNTPVEENILVIVSDGYESDSKRMHVEIYKEPSRSATMGDSLLSFLWLIILIIIIIVILTGYATYRWYIGDYHLEEVYWINNVGLLLFHGTSAPDKAPPQVKKTKRRSRGKRNAKKSDMLGVILNLTEGAFPDKGENTKEYKSKNIQINGKNILLERGKYTFLALIYSGRVGKRLSSMSSHALLDVENKYRRTTVNSK